MSESILLRVFTKSCTPQDKYAFLYRQTIELTPKVKNQIVVYYGYTLFDKTGKPKNVLVKRRFSNKPKAISFLLDRGFRAIDDLSESASLRRALGKR